MDEKCIWNAFVGSLNGLTKGIRVSTKGVTHIKNFIPVRNAGKVEVTCLSWGNNEETEVMIGLSNRCVKIYNTKAKCFTSTVNAFQKYKDCTLKGLSRYDGKLFAGLTNGKICMSNDNSTDDILLFDAGNDLERMMHSTYDSKCVATGGKENDLKLWDLETKEKTFTAKNVRPDELQLRVPVWISDIAFLASPKVAISSRHGFVRLYDPSTPSKRPVASVHIKDQALTCISRSSRDEHVLVGSGSGHMFLVDLRNKGVLLNHYKGFVGGIRQIACSNTGPYIVSVGLDRHFRVHNLDSKELLYKEYLQSQLSTVLLRSDFSISQLDDDVEVIKDPVSYKDDSSVKVKSDSDGSEESDASDKALVRIKLKKQRKQSSELKTILKTIKRKKQNVCDVNDEDSIKIKSEKKGKRQLNLEKNNGEEVLETKKRKKLKIRKQISNIELDDDHDDKEEIAINEKVKKELERINKRASQRRQN